MLLFFKNVGGRLEQFDPAFARSSEDVSDRNSLWVRAVQVYIRVSQMPAAEQSRALQQEIATLREDEDYSTLKNSLLVDDIERQLAGCGPISDFGDRPGKCNNPRWLYNFVNADYWARNPEPEIINASETATTRTQIALITAGILTAFVLLALAIWVRVRKTNVP